MPPLLILSFLIAVGICWLTTGITLKVIGWLKHQTLCHHNNRFLIKIAISMPCVTISIAFEIKKMRTAILLFLGRLFTFGGKINQNTLIEQSLTFNNNNLEMLVFS